MTEAEWLACRDSLDLCEFLWELSERKSRLFACACGKQIAQRVWRPERPLKFVEVVERLADGVAMSRAEEEFSTREVWVDHCSKWQGVNDPLWLRFLSLGGLWPRFQPQRVLRRGCEAAGEEATRQSYRWWRRRAIRNDAIAMEQAAYLDLARDIFGNPFRPVAFDPEWRSDTALSLARHIYEARDFTQMPILADALQDAGSNNPDILAHCRDADQVHVRGCWVVDLVLGKS